MVEKITAWYTSLQENKPHFNIDAQPDIITA
jgi:hypothetical protein